MVIGFFIGGFMFYVHGVVNQELFEKIQYSVSFALFLFVGFILAINIASYLHLRPSNMHVSNNKHVQTAGNVELHTVGDSTSTTNIENKRTTENKRYAVKTLIIITLFYLICNLPLPIFTVVGMINQNLVENHYSMYAVGILFFIMIANNGINAVVYMLRTKKIKNYYKQMIWK